MNSSRRLLALIALLLGVAVAPTTFGQILLTEDFTQTTSSVSGGVGNWLFFNGACLTAGTSTVLTSPGTTVPGCVAVLNSYYVNAQDHDQYLMGGSLGYLGSSSPPSSPSNQQADASGSGALRFTNGSPYGNQERGAIVSTNAYSTSAGLQVTFKTTTYGGTGADGISFYLMDGCVPVAGAVMPSCTANPLYPTGSANVPAIGATGGSLAYTCSNTNGPGSGTGVTYDGLTGAYLGLGIDEYGNFLNQGDNTASGYGFQPGRIGLRGAGAISWPALNNAYGSDPGSLSKPYYPSSLSAAAQQTAIQQTCSTGQLWNYKNASNGTSTNSAGPATLPTDPNNPNPYNTAKILDYPAIVGDNVPSGNPLYNNATIRSNAHVILYNLKITTDGYLSLSFSYDGGANQNILSPTSITSSNGSLPQYVRFGFAGSTGGATNVHEILCFKSTPNLSSASSAGVNQQESSKVQTGSFAYFAYYNPNNWSGDVTANALNTDSSGNVTISAQPTWDASCDLTGVATGYCSTGAGPSAATPTPANRVILTYNGGGTTLLWGSLSTAQQTALETGDGNTTAAQYRLNYLRGDRTYEVNSAGTCASGGPTVQIGGQTTPLCFRARASVLGDIIDSSPTWVGPPQDPYTANWVDKLNSSASLPENSGQSYAAFQTSEQSRPNVVYAGSNDGLLHGFRSGAFSSPGVFNTASANDGLELIAYMPGSLLLSASTGGACATMAATGSIVQNIHGVTPSYTPSSGPTQSACVSPQLDFSNQQYGHNFYVDATPGTDDLYYNNAWHTWLVGGLGAGGAAIYAMEVTNPGNFSTASPSNLVIGEWTSKTISCSGTANCGNNLGNTYGTPIIRRLHNGLWAVIFGNGYGSTSGDAGIFIMTVSATGSTTFYYLSTGNTGTAKNNGIGYVTSADLDGDHITDYVYAGDLMGNLWRFDLTSAAAASWAVTPGPLFSTPTGQPITTAVTVASGATPAGSNTLMISFGTGQRTQFTNTLGVSYQGATQSLYGVWDWNMAGTTGWNAKSSVPYASLTSPPGLSSPYTLTQSNLQQQKFSINATDKVTRDIAGPSTICWAGTSGCTTGGTGGTAQYGWYLNLIGTQEQIVYNPELLQGVFLVNSVVPAGNKLTSCTVSNDTGFTYAISVLTGAAPPSFFISYADANASGVQLNAVGTSSVVTSSVAGNPLKYFLIYQTTSGTQGPPGQVAPPANTQGRRLSWVQLR
jgi:type IV pilus assembly protein PilY1